MINIIPAIDLIDGRCVRLSQGDYARKKVYDADPLDMALRFEDCGLGSLHLVDLDGAKASQPVNLAVLEKISSKTSLLTEWGGGLKSLSSIRSCFDAGAHKAICGSIAADNPALFKESLFAFGPSRMVLGADVRDGKVSTHGWLFDSGLTIEQLVEQFLEDGLQRMVCTDISRDGMLKGPAFELYASLLEKYPDVETTVSGGVSSMADIEKASSMGLKSIITGKALYEGKITLKDISLWLQNA